jgi:Leucine-rich repeat (LRR) protein
MLLQISAFLAVSTLAWGDSWIAAYGGTAVKDNDGQVIEISFRSAWVTDSDLVGLLNFPRLRRLDLSRTHINDRGLGFLKALTELRDLDLTYAEHITDAGLAHLRSLKRLERLVLEGTKVSDSGMSSLASLTSLRILNLRCTQITDGALEQIEFLPKLEELSIGGNRIAGFGLVFLQSLEALKHLDLSGTQLTDDGVWSVTLTDLNIQIIATLQTLETLNLAASELIALGALPDGGIRETATIKVTDLGIEELKTLKNLRSLNLARSHVTSRGLEILRELPRLHRLNLAYVTNLDSTAVKPISQLKLDFIDISGSKLSNTDLEAIRRALPKCRIIGENVDTNFTFD